MKKWTLTSYTPYPSRKIRRICACTSQETMKNKVQYAISRRLPYAVCKIQNVKILEDIKRDPYSKKPLIRRIDLNQYAVSIKFQTI
ncbi:hypothetical protein Tco_0710541 [Tanacetum coccineum]